MSYSRNIYSNNTSRNFKENVNVSKESKVSDPCNIAIAKAKDSPKILRAMAKYLEDAEKLSQG